MSNFEANGEAVEEIEQTLQAAASGGSDSKAALNRIDELRQDHNFFNYCACILAQETREERQVVRQLAGYYLKNNIGNPMCTNNPVVQEFVMITLGDANPHVRRAVSSIITTAVLREVWPPEIVTTLIERLRGDDDSVAGAIMTISSIVEDHVEILDALGLAEPVINAIVPYITHPSPSVREHTTIAISVLMEQAGLNMEGSVFAVLGGCIASVVQLLLEAIGNGPGNKETQFILRSLVLSLVFYEQLGHLFNQIGEIMLTATEQATDEEIRKEAVEFWRAVLYFPNFSDAARPLMGRILPIILRCMIYSDMELGMMGAKECDWDVEDKIDDVKPRAYEGRSHKTKRDDEENEDEDGDEEVDQYNLRRVAALTLDDIAEHYGDEILDAALGVVSEMLASGDWKVIEAGVLAIGAVADGCYAGMVQYLDSIVAQLLEMINSSGSNFLVRNTALWAIGKYPNFLMDPSKASVLETYLKVVLGNMESQSKLIQETSTAALQELVSAATDGELNNYIAPIIDTVNRCFKLPYQLKNRYLLFECVQSICNCFGRLLSDDQSVNTLMEPLMFFWNDTANDSPMIFPFFQCMTFVCDALGPFIEPIAEDMFTRTYNMAVFHLDARREAARTNTEPPEVDYLIVALDLLSAVLEAMGSALEPLVSSNEPHFMNYLLAAVRDEDPLVRKSGFAVIGDMCSGCVNHCQVMLDDLCSAMVQNLQDPQPETLSIKVASNVAWAFGELIANQNMTEAVPQIGPQHTRTITPLLMDVLATVETEDDRNVADNVCLALGRIFTVDPDALSSTNVGLAFLPKWLKYMRSIKNLPQKDQAVRGVLGIVSSDPATVAENVTLWIELFATLDAAPDMRDEIKRLLTDVKNGLGGRWAGATNEVSRETMNLLFRKYSIR